TFNTVESIEAPDLSTVTITWKGLFADADALLSGPGFKPMPRHVLEESYMADKASFPNLPYWTQGYVGSGPYKVQSWVPGSYYLFATNDQYVLGRPNIDEIELRFIGSADTRMANLLGGAVDMTFGRGLAVQQAMDLRQQWAGGRVAFQLEDFWIAI